METDQLRSWLHSLFTVPAGGTFLDLGCGSGADLKQIARLKPAATFVGLDQSPKSIPDINLVRADASGPLPFPTESIDVLYSVNLLECIPDKAAFLRECARVIRPGGTILMAHYDWDTQTFDGDDRPAVRKILHAFNDWKQGWMQDIDPWAGRRLWRFFADQPFQGQIHTHTLTSTSFEPDSYARQQADSFQALVRNNLISQEEFESFHRFLEESAARKAFFYSVTMFAYVGTKLG